MPSPRRWTSKASPLVKDAGVMFKMSSCSRISRWVLGARPTKTCLRKTQFLILGSNQRRFSNLVRNKQVLRPSGFLCCIVIRSYRRTFIAADQACSRPLAYFTTSRVLVGTFDAWLWRWRVKYLWVAETIAVNAQRIYNLTAFLPSCLGWGME
jgi:hypothetical protein